MYGRIKSHNIPYAELLDELFAWYTHARLPMAKQILLLKKRFYPACTMMDMDVLRHVSMVHPMLRLNYILMDRMFRERELRDLARIPTAQVPYVSWSSNVYLKLFVWGVRSKTDQFLIRRMIKKKTNTRHRVLKSIDWPGVYQQGGAVAAVSEWFEKDHINRKKLIGIVERRASLAEWVYSTFDIISPASLNLELELIDSLRARRDAPTPLATTNSPS